MGWGEGTGNDNFNLINSTGSNFPSQWGRGSKRNVCPPHTVLVCVIYGCLPDQKRRPSHSMSVLYHS